MRVTESTLLFDRLVITLRWLVLIGITVSLNGGGMSGSAVVLVAVVGLWNIFLTYLSMTNNRLTNHRNVVIGIDGIIGVLFFFLSDINNAPYVWGIILPTLTGAFYFGLKNGLIITGALVLFEGIGLVVVLPDDALALSIIGAPALVLLGLGLVLGFLAEQVGLRIKARRDMEISAAQEKERVERERIKALYNITSELTASLNYKRILDMALDLTGSALVEPGVGTKLVSAFYLYEEDEMVLGSSRRFTPPDMKATLSGREGITAQALQTGLPKFTRTPSRDPDIRRVVALRNCNSVYCFPLRAGSDSFGVLLFGHPSADFFDNKRREIMEIVSRQVMVALQNAQLYQDLEEEKERMMEIQEETRKNLARNLHDGPTQSVAAIAMRVNFARRMIERDVKAAADELFKIEDLARRTTKEIRHMLFTLRPLVLETSGLIDALKSMAQKMEETFEQNVIIEAEKGIMDELEMGKQGVLFYIAEEAVNNARKHAVAEHIWVRLKKTRSNVVLLEVEDDGVGFDVGAVDSGYEQRGSLGMVNMRERTELVNGVLQLESKEGVGTRIRVWIPLTEDAADQLRRGGR